MGEKMSSVVTSQLVEDKPEISPLKEESTESEEKMGLVVPKPTATPLVEQKHNGSEPDPNVNKSKFRKILSCQRARLLSKGGKPIPRKVKVRPNIPPVKRRLKRKPRIK